MRRKLDLYETDGLLTRHLLRRVNIRGRIVEPAAGPGAIARVFLGYEVITNDIDPQHPTHFHGDATDPFHPMWNKPFGEAQWVKDESELVPPERQKRFQPDWVIANPPFNEAHNILPLAYSAAQVGVAFLLRLSYLEPCGNRGAWLQAHAPYMTNLIIFGQPRPSFTGNGRTDNVTTAWMVWRKPHLVPLENSTKMDFVPNWKDLANERR